MEITSGFVYLVVIQGPTAPTLLDEIVVPLDGSSESEHAVPIATDLAIRTGAGLRLLTTKADVGDHSPSFYLDSVAARVADAVEVTTDVIVDAAPADSIVDSMHPGKVGVCMATHARGRFLGALHHGVAETVVAARRGPVFLVGPSCTATRIGDGPVLFAHDGTTDATATGHILMPLLAGISAALTLVTVVSAPSGKSTDDPYREVKRAADSVVDDATQHGMSARHRLAFATNVRRGILDEIAAVEPSLLVLAAHPRTTMHRLRDGSTTADIVHSSPVPVLVC